MRTVAIKAPGKIFHVLINWKLPDPLYGNKLYCEWMRAIKPRRCTQKPCVGGKHIKEGDHYLLITTGRTARTINGQSYPIKRGVCRECARMMIYKLPPCQPKERTK